MTKIIDKMRSSYFEIIIFAVIIGLGAGFGSVLYHLALNKVTWFFTGYNNYTTNPGAPSKTFEWLGRYFLIFAPILGAIIYGPLISFFAPKTKGHGVSEIIYSVAKNQGKLNPKIWLTKVIASIFTVGSGGSLGTEGPIAQVGAGIGSWICKTFRVTPTKAKLLVASGAGAGIAATFNAPFAGPFFALELILGHTYTADAFIAVTLSSLVATLVSRYFNGSSDFLHLPLFSNIHDIEYLFFIILGISMGFIGILFTKVSRHTEEFFARFYKGPAWAKPASLAIFLGIILFFLPQLYGSGIPIIQNVIENKYALGLLIILALFKILAASVTLGIGGSGGVFVPSLFIGATGGTAIGELFNLLDPSIHVNPGLYGLIGMGACFASATRAYITSTLIIVDITGQYGLILPLLTAISFATVISKAICKDTVYTYDLRQKGIMLDDNDKIIG